MVRPGDARPARRHRPQRPAAPSIRRRSPASRSRCAKGRRRRGLRRHDQHRGGAGDRGDQAVVRVAARPGGRHGDRGRGAEGPHPALHRAAGAALRPGGAAGWRRCCRWCCGCWARRVKEAVLRGLSLLVAASPCALAISTPAAVLAAVARAARGGVLFKGGAHLESLGKVAALAFDKTGTLTEGKPRLITRRARGRRQRRGAAVHGRQPSRRCPTTRSPRPSSTAPPSAASPCETGRRLRGGARQGAALAHRRRGGVHRQPRRCSRARRCPPAIGEAMTRARDRRADHHAGQARARGSWACWAWPTAAPRGASETLQTPAGPGHQPHGHALGRQPARRPGGRRRPGHRRSARAPAAGGQGQGAARAGQGGRRGHGRRRHQRRARAGRRLGRRGHGRRRLGRRARDRGRGADERRPAPPAVRRAPGPPGDRGSSARTWSSRSASAPA